MPVSSNITTTSGNAVAFTVPAGAVGFQVLNEGDTTIYIREDQQTSVSTTAGNATRGIPLVAAQNDVPTHYSRQFERPLEKPLAICAIHEGTGDKTLTWDALML